MNNWLKWFILFLILNFAALAIGGLFTGEGVPSDWYQELNKAPWTPPGWVFGTMWTLIMICLAFFMAYAMEKVADRKSLILNFAIQWILNVIWNPTFFYFKEVLIGLIFITLLTLLIGFMIFRYKKELPLKVLFLVPYFIWLIIASSLNAYVLMYN